MSAKTLKHCLVSLAITVAMFSACKQRQSNLTGIDGSLNGLLDLSKVSDPKALSDLCSQDTFVLFVGNAETLGRIEPNPKASEAFRPEYLSQLQKNDHAKELWYFSKIKEEYAALLKKMLFDDPACKGSDIDSRGIVLAILDGPGVGDSIIEVSSFRRDSKGTRDAKTQRMQFNTKTKKLSAQSPGQTLELLMPRDVSDIMSAFRDATSKQYPYWFGIKILKGHGVTIHSGGDFGLRDALAGMLEIGSNVYPMTMLDSQDENGYITSSIGKNFYKMPMWTPETLCREVYGAPDSVPYKACMDDTNTRLNQGFQVANMAGCRGSRLERLAQGDSKQGDSKQGDSKQGDSKQGDSKQGDSKQGDSKQGAGQFLQDLTGMDFGPNARQGGKGFSVPSKIADGPNLGGLGPEPAAFRIIGSGRTLGDFFVKGLDLDLPIQAHQELVILDSCNMDAHHALPFNWLRNAPNRLQPKTAKTLHPEKAVNTDTVLLMNSFPVSADAVDYSALNLQQYYFLTASVLENKSRIVPKVQTSLRTYLQQSSEKERIKKLQKNMSTLENRKFTDPEDIYCSLYAQLYACNDKFCEQLPQSGDSVDELHRVASGFRSIEVIDALLIELKHNRDLPEAMIKNLRNTLFSSVNFSDSILGTVAVQRDVGLLLDGGLIHPNMPIVRQMLVRYFELLQKLIQAETFGMTVKLDPMLLDFLISGLQVLPPGVSSHSGSPTLFAPQPMDPAKFYRFALNQTATSESIEAYLARHAASSAKISALEKDYLKTPSTTPNASADAAYERLMQAFLAASQEPGV